MFEFSITKQALLTPLLTVAGAVDKKQSLAILGNILLKTAGNELWLTATDLEIEVTAKVPCNVQKSGIITVPAKKMVDIIRSLEDNAIPSLSCEQGVVIIQEGRTKFKLATLPAENYPNSEDEPSEMELSLPREALIHLLQSTHFSISQNDVRVFLNGLLLELDAQTISMVATDGHRMAICRFPWSIGDQHHRLLIPRKGAQEILRLLNNITDEQVTLSAGKSHLKLVTSQYTFLSKLIEARFPPYQKAIPRDQDKQVLIDRDLLRRALQRISILAHEKSRAVLLNIQANQLTLVANNQEQEEAVEVLEAETQGDELQIGINASYLLDVLNYVDAGMLRLSLSSTESSIMVESIQDEHYQYVIMPMKI
jgi:DNA polymerase-3 subunit beta